MQEANTNFDSRHKKMQDGRSPIPRSRILGHAAICEQDQFEGTISKEYEKNSKLLDAGDSGSQSGMNIVLFG